MFLLVTIRYIFWCVPCNHETFVIAKVSLKKKLIHITMEEICIKLFEFSRCWKKASNFSKKFRLSSNGQAGRKKKSNFHNFLHGDINNPYNLIKKSERPLLKTVIYHEKTAELKCSLKINFNPLWIRRRDDPVTMPL